MLCGHGIALSAEGPNIAPTRPVLRWHGGKWRLAPWIISYFPPHRIYVEPFGGAASVLLLKQRSHAEVYNDLDHQAVNLFRVLRNEAQARRLIEALRLTPFARQEFVDALDPTDEPIEMARRLAVRSYMGFGSNAHSSPASGRSMTGFRSTGFRSNSNRSGTTPAHDWAHYPDALQSIVERLRGVVIENADALDVMKRHDGADTLHYVDPPYLPETRSPANKLEIRHRMYRHELSREDHVRLLEFLNGLAGMVVLSGYPSPLYDDVLSRWLRIEREAYADGARLRHEVLWLNAAATQKHGPLFDVARGAPE
jgi:DNA adenine methylase